VDELRARLQKMTDEELLRFGHLELIESNCAGQVSRM
jgi:hypothetical protein